MVCKMQFKWVKLPRNLNIPQKGVLYNWFCLGRSAAYSEGKIKYVNHHNPVAAGEWAGGIVGLKSILQKRDKKQALEALFSLNELDYLSSFVS